MHEQFRNFMGKLTITFHPIFIIFAFIMIFFGWLNEFVVYMIVLILHELAHYVTAKILGYKLNKILFMPYGVGISGEHDIFKPSHEVIIALAGPLLNIVLSIITVAIWWKFPITYFYTDQFVFANLSLGIFNLLPVFPLDGGRVFVALASKKISKLKALKIMNAVAILFALLFAVTFVLSVFVKVNLTFIFIAGFLASSIFGNTKNVYYERSYESLVKGNLVKPLPVKTYLISSKTPVHKLVKYMNGNEFVQFMVMNENKKVIKILNETDVKNLILNTSNVINNKQ